MASFMKTASAIFAAGVLCGAGALAALAPTPPNASAEPAIARPKSPVVTTTAVVPCKEQVWPLIDRRCMKWTAEGWTAHKADPNSGAGSNGAVSPELPAARAAEEPRTIAEAGVPAQAAPSPSVESRSITRPTTANAHQGARAEPKPAQRAQHRSKVPRKSQVARNRHRDGDYRDSWNQRDYGYQDYRDYRHRDRRRMTGAARDAASDFFIDRRMRPSGRHGDG